GATRVLAGAPRDQPRRSRGWIYLGRAGPTDLHGHRRGHLFGGRIARTRPRGGIRHHLPRLRRARRRRVEDLACRLPALTRTLGGADAPRGRRGARDLGRARRSPDDTPSLPVGREERSLRHPAAGSWWMSRAGSGL